MNFLKYMMGSILLMDEAGDGKGGGGAGGDGKGGTPDPSKELDTLKSQNADLLKRLEALEGKKTDPAPEPDLASKAAKEREELEKAAGHEKRLEAAIKFNQGSKDWLKNNAALLPKSIEGIFTQAEKENFANAIEKDQAVKAGIVSEFFSIQANLDLLTESQKSQLAEFLKLTKTVKQERAQQFFDQVFEPTFEALKRQKKAELLAKGIASPGDADVAYKDKMVLIARKRYLGEVKNGS